MSRGRRIRWSGMNDPIPLGDSVDYWPVPTEWLDRFPGPEAYEPIPAWTIRAKARRDLAEAEREREAKARRKEAAKLAREEAAKREAERIDREQAEEARRKADRAARIERDRIAAAERTKREKEAEERAARLRAAWIAERARREAELQAAFRRGPGVVVALAEGCTTALVRYSDGETWHACDTRTRIGDTVIPVRVESSYHHYRGT